MFLRDTEVAVTRSIAASLSFLFSLSCVRSLLSDQKPQKRAGRQRCTAVVPRYFCFASLNEKKVLRSAPSPRTPFLLFYTAPVSAALESLMANCTFCFSPSAEQALRTAADEFSSQSGCCASAVYVLRTLYAMNLSRGDHGSAQPGPITATRFRTRPRRRNGRPRLR